MGRKVLRGLGIVNLDFKADRGGSPGAPDHICGTDIYTIKGE